MIWAQGLLNLLVTLLINRKLWSFEQNRSGPKVDLSRSKKNTSLANSPLLFRSREARFWTRFWPSTEERSHLKTEERRAMVAKIYSEAKAGSQIINKLIYSNQRTDHCVTFYIHLIVAIFQTFNTLICLQSSNLSESTRGDSLSQKLQNNHFKFIQLI